jgi:circadian clock protein KaiC
LQHDASTERISSGVPDLDDMLEGKGYFRGSSILFSGTAGSGKTTLAASFIDAACRRGERCLYIGFEESRSQVERNMQSIGIDLKKWTKKALLFHDAWRPTQFGIEMHLLRIHRLIERLKPKCVVIDPITNLITGSSEREVYSMLVRLIDFLKGAGITAVFVSLTDGGDDLEETNVGVSSLTDTWILLRDVELNGERNRCLYVLKSRGMAHSNQVREFVMTNQGIRLIPAYIGAGGVLTGSSRLSQEARERAEAVKRIQENRRRQEELNRKRTALQAQISSLQAEVAAVEQESHLGVLENKERERELSHERDRMAASRHYK